MCELSPVSFHGDTIFVIELNDQPFTPMKPIVENLGLDWGTQFRKLNGNAKRWGIVIMTIPSESGEQETLCMPVRKLPAYLASINPNKVREDLRAKIELYQNESDDALWNYWMNGRAERKFLTNPTSPDSPLTPDQQCTLRAIVKSRVERLDPQNKGQLMAFYSQVWSRFANHFRIAKYSQLPQSKMSEAVAYLVNMEIRQAKKIEAPGPKDMPQSDDVALDADIYADGKRVFDMLSEIRLKLDSVTGSMLFLRSARRAVLSPEKQILFDNLCDCVMAAGGGVNIAILNVRSACRLRSRVDFMTR